MDGTWENSETYSQHMCSEEISSFYVPSHINKTCPCKLRSCGIHTGQDRTGWTVVLLSSDFLVHPWGVFETRALVEFLSYYSIWLG